MEEEEDGRQEVGETALAWTALFRSEGREVTGKVMDMLQLQMWVRETRSFKL